MLICIYLDEHHIPLHQTLHQPWVQGNLHGLQLFQSTSCGLAVDHNDYYMHIHLQGVNYLILKD